MKIKKHRKYTLARMRYNNVYKWRIEKFIRKIAEAFIPLSKALEQAYAKARNERQLQQE
jgi:hypothetical protein